MNSPALSGSLFSFALWRQASACCPRAEHSQSNPQKKEAWVRAKTTSQMRVEEKCRKSALPGGTPWWPHQWSLVM